MAEKIKKGFFKVLPWSVAVLMIFAVSIGVWQNYVPIARAVAGEGTANIDGGADGGNVTVERAVSHTFTVVLTVGASGITVDADNPTFEIPAGFTVPDASPVATPGAVVADGNWSAVGGATCPITLGTSGAAGQVITVDVTTVCTVGAGGTITLTYKGTSAVTMGATNLTVSTTDAIGDNPVVPIAASPTITVTDTIAPVVTARETFDNNSNGKIDQIDFTTTENLDDAFTGITVAVTTPAFVVSNIDTGDTAHDNKFRVYLTENALGGCTGPDQSGCDTDATPATQITANTTLSDWNGADVGNNIAVDVGTVNATDKALPVFLVSAYLNTDNAPDNPGKGNVGGGDPDIGDGLTALTNCEVGTGGVANEYDNNEDVYISTHAVVTVGDQRLTGVAGGTYNIGSIVAGGDSDIGSPLETLTQCKVTGGDGTWTSPEHVYDDIDTPGANTVSAGDSRIYYPSSPGDTVNILLLLYSEPVTYAALGTAYADGEWTATANDLTGFDVTSCFPSAGPGAGMGCANALGGFKGIALTVSGVPANLTGVSGGTEPTIAYTYATEHIQDMATVPNYAADIFPAATIYDAANPVMVSAEYLDINPTDGTVDTIRTTWSENVLMGTAPGSSTSTTDDWTITGGSINAAFSSATDDASAGHTLDVQVTADANETGGAVDPTISYNNGDNNNSVTDDSAVVGYNAAGSTPPGGPATVADAAEPVVLSITPSDTLLTDADVLTAFTVTVVYDETMDNTGAHDPNINFTPDVGLFTGLLFSSGGWGTTSVLNDTYTATYNLVDLNEYLTGIDIGVTGAQDVAAIPNTQVAGSSVDAFDIDVRNPTGTVAIAVDPINVVNDTQTVTVTYGEAMDPLTNPTISFSAGSLASNSDGGWNPGNTVWTETFTDAASETVGGVTASVIAGATDVAGNLETVGAPSAAFDIDRQAPVGTVAIAVDPINVVNDTQTVTVTYGEAMDPLTNPTISFSAGSLASNSDGGWNPGNTVWTETFTDAASETVGGVTASVIAGATDVAGNLETVGAPSAAFDIDRQAPTGTVVVDTDPMYDGDLIQGVTVTYDEPMNAGSTPTITFGGNVGALTSNSDGAWNGGPVKTVWTESFTLTDAGETTAGVTADSSGATDVAGNTEGADVGDTFDIDTHNPVITIHSPANGGHTQMADPLIVETDENATCTYNLDAGGITAVSNTGGFYHTDNLTGLTAASHTVAIACVDTVGNTSNATSTWTKMSPGSNVLYGTKGQGSHIGDLYTINPETGAILSDIGSTGTCLTGLATDPITGDLYGVSSWICPTNSDPGNTVDLFSVDKGSGLATFIAPLSGDVTSNCGNLGDIDFDASGNLYGVDCDGYYYSVNKTTGATAEISQPETVSTYGNGLAYDSATDQMYWLPGGETFDPFNPPDGNLDVLDASSGVLNTTITLANDSGNYVALGAAKIDAAGMLFAVRYGSSPSPHDFVVIDKASGIITPLGTTPNNPDMSLMSAIAFGEVYSGGGWGGGGGGGGGSTLPPTITVTAPNGGETLTGGETYEIDWSYTGTGTVNLYYSTDSGINFNNTIATGETNDGKYTWTVPNIATTTAKVKVGSGSLYDISNANFTITYTTTLPPTTPPPTTPPPTTPPSNEEIPASELHPGDVFKSDLATTVYYYGSDNMRHIFPNETTYKSWYPDFSNIRTVLSADMPSIPVGHNVTIRPGTVLVKIQTDPKVYAVEPNGLLRWVPTEARAATLYGSDWATKIVDVPLIFWVDYTFGSDINVDQYPTGTLVKYSSSPDVYYVQNGEKRKLSSAGFTANGFQDKYILTTTISYATSTDITGAEDALARIY